MGNSFGAAETHSCDVTVYVAKWWCTKLQPQPAAGKYPNYVDFTSWLSWHTYWTFVLVVVAGHQWALCGIRSQIHNTWPATMLSLSPIEDHNLISPLSGKMKWSYTFHFCSWLRLWLYHLLTYCKAIQSSTIASATISNMRAYLFAKSVYIPIMLICYEIYIAYHIYFLPPTRTMSCRHIQVWQSSETNIPMGMFSTHNYL